MKSKLVILASTLIVVMAAGQMEPDYLTPDSIVSDTYRSQDAGEIKLIGICNRMRPDIQCWNPDGTLNLPLANEVAEKFQKAAAAEVRTTELPIRVPRKNRILVFQITPNSASPNGFGQIDGFYTPDGHYLPQLNLPPMLYGVPHDECFEVNEDNSQSTVDLFVKFSHRANEPNLVPMKEGAQTTIDQKTFTIGSITTGPEDPKRGEQTADRKSWRILVKIAGDSSTAKLKPSVIGADIDGRVFKSVNPDGKPVRWLRLRKTQALPANGAVGQGFVFMNGLGPYQPDLGARIFTSFIDPSYIHYLQVSLATITNIQFKNIPLDPK